MQATGQASGVLTMFTFALTLAMLKGLCEGADSRELDAMPPQMPPGFFEGKKGLNLGDVDRFVDDGSGNQWKSTVDTDGEDYDDDNDDDGDEDGPEGQFMGLSPDDLKKQCAKLQDAEKNEDVEQLKWVQQQSFYEGLKRVCEALKTGDEETFKRAVAEEKRNVGQYAKKAAKGVMAKPMALGCTMLLGAKDNGKMEWFESQGWYRKALDMCQDLAGAGGPPEDLKTQMATTEGQVKEFLQKKKTMPLDLLKNTCSKLATVPEQQQQTEWYVNAQHLCATVASSSPDELKQLLQQQKEHAETASGQLLKQTCEKLQGENMEKFASSPWFGAVQQMCMNMAAPEVKSDGIEERCKFFQQLKASGQDAEFKSQGWYDHLETTCKFLQKGRPGSFEMPGPVQV